MKFKLFIRPHEEEFVQAQVHQKSSFTDQLAEFVASDGQPDSLIVYDDTDLLQLPFDEITIITIISGKTYAINNQRKNL